jgi:hypothetical protein
MKSRPREHTNERVDLDSESSFPASDPPPHGRTRTGGPLRRTTLEMPERTRSTKKAEPPGIEPAIELQPH